MYRNNKILNILDSLYGASATALTVSNPILSRIRNIYLDNITDDVIGTYLSKTKIIDYPLDQEKLRRNMFALYESYVCEKEPASLFFDRHMYLQNDLLFKNDFSSMASSIEARVPLVDKEVFAYVESVIPKEMCLSRNYPEKYLLKKVLELYLPHELVYRDKKGFGFSFEKYNVPQFNEDVRQAVAFHYTHADIFNLMPHRPLFKEMNADIFIKKYPRFAFALVSNWKIFKN